MPDPQREKRQVKPSLCRRVLATFAGLSTPKHSDVVACTRSDLDRPALTSACTGSYATFGVGTFAVMACTLQHGHCRGSTLHFMAQPPNRCFKPYQNGTSRRIGTASRRMHGNRFQSRPQDVSTPSPCVSQATLHGSTARSHATVLAFLAYAYRFVGLHVQ